MNETTKRSGGIPTCPDCGYVQGHAWTCKTLTRDKIADLEADRKSDSHLISRQSAPLVDCPLCGIPLSANGVCNEHG
jgi:hypothetical protein